MNKYLENMKKYLEGAKKFIEKLPFRALAEKIPAEKREKYPLLGRAIPFANQIACCLALLLVVTVIACSGGGGGSVTVGGVKVKIGRAAPSTDFSYELNADKTGVIITAYSGGGGSLVIPGEIEGYPVVAFSDDAFCGEVYQYYNFLLGNILDGNDNGAGLVSVVIPASVKSIGRRCFYKIDTLTSVTILGTEVGIRSNAFLDCANLSELNIQDGDNVLSAGDSNAFDGCKKLPLAMRSRLEAMGFTRI